MGWCGGTGHRAIRGSENGGNRVRGNSSPTDVDQCADNVANHVAEESVGRNIDDHPTSPTVYGQVRNGAHRVPGGAPGGAKGGKVMSSQEVPAGPAHVVQVDVEWRVPGTVTVNGRAGTPQEKKVAIGFSESGVLGIELGGNLASRQNGQGRRGQAVHCPQDLLRFQPAPGKEVGHLTKGVHPCVGPARALHRHSFAGDPGDALLKNRLNRWSLRLHLPAVKVEPVIFQEKTDVAVLWSSAA